MLVQTFNKILTDKYLINGIVRSVNRIDKNIQALDTIIANEPSISPLAKQIYQSAKQQYQNMIGSLQIPLEEVCNYATGTLTDIDQKLLRALNIVHQELRKIVQTIDQDILDKITPWENSMLMDTALEEEVRGYANLIGTILLTLVIFLAIIPVGFAILILLSCLCNCNGSESSSGSRFVNIVCFVLGYLHSAFDSIQLRMSDVNRVSDIPSRNSYSNRQNYQSPKLYRRQHS